MKRSSGTLALISFALCLPVHAQDIANSSPSAAQPASVAASSTHTVGLSDIRIVRLSQVRGTVNIDRHIGRGYEEAFANVPITGGTKLHTDVGLAEVEFEDNSTLRLTPDTEVEFTLLKRTATGSTISEMNVLHGMVYANLANTKGNTFTIAAGKASVQMNPSSHIRLTMDGLNSNISVLDGAVDFTDPFAFTSTIPHKKSLDFDASGTKQPEFAKMQETAFDEWDKNGIDYHKQYSSLRSAGGTGMAFGSSDLNYYGSFSNGGCGSMWRPYFASAAWSPYDNGMWAYYPSAGYSWVSPYPWGWLPFHSGNWVNCGGAGWGWQPGNQWNGLQNLTTITPAGGGGANRSLVSAPLPPRGGAPAMVPVNNRPLAVSSVSGPGTYTFRKDSAGLGVPRDAFGDLKSISSDVVRHGQVNTEIERSVIGPSPAFAHRNANGDIGNRGANAHDGNPNVNGARASFNHDASPGSRGVATFSRPNSDMHANGMNDMNGMNRGMNNANSPGNSTGSPHGSWQRPESAGSSGAPMPRSMGESRSNASAPSSGGGSAQPSTAGGSHK
jgi:hypothetical protein